MATRHCTICGCERPEKAWVKWFYRPWPGVPSQTDDVCPDCEEWAEPLMRAPFDTKAAVRHLLGR